ncbi:efflux RND transporter periplasmic adaptor subunit [Achromobacter xylosoxidans]|uniref:efflux RND transporter periplasmic adaptor subunit n=2 Tax=Alcaligenes xylosoxydans xylosoxydans TaxID=85698 RepID=UPI0004F7FD68|nr:efflux RND transporter periplasmic adaptor subunit [Achromobacter xylosoxidans]OFQ47168.1 efflux transporter periplasmic adaptor subunit [Achromobacter xylosoxidans]QQE58637.1 efflux RND transporter periplasmic adaptor subunit [Achromobacter xylosoxidans]QQV12384.1 efflux RND transporter periplasmic adaptor subunit [Achromobacter xylosoxidans]UXL02427.1 efflux RND transporter periplasmic adaptor subunit [Achromobacter xylosoxidans]CUI59479.1 Acriflavine resistance protein A precursor [Achro
MPLPFSAGPANVRRRLALAGLVAVAMLAAWAGWTVWRYALPGPAPAAIPSYAQQPVAVSVAAARSGPLPRDLHALGTITPLARVVLRSQVDGQLQRLHYTEGQAVRRGQLLAEIDPRPYQAALAAAEGELARVEALLGNAEIDLRRYRQLARQEAVAGQQLDTAEAQARSYAAQRQRLAAAVADARRLLALTRIVAPHDGRIGLRRVDAGNHVRAGDADGLATLVQTRPISALFTLAETRLDLLRQAQAGDGALQVQAWDADERRLLALGTLQALDNQIHAASGTVKLRALFENADEALFPNQFVNIRLALARQEDVLSIPTAAVQYGADGAFVFVIGDDQRATRRELTLGRANAGRVEVRSGLAAAERVVVEGVDRLHDGRDVLIVETQ